MEDPLTTPLSPRNVQAFAKPPADGAAEPAPVGTDGAGLAPAAGSTDGAEAGPAPAADTNGSDEAGPTPAATDPVHATDASDVPAADDDDATAEDEAPQLPPSSPRSAAAFETLEAAKAALADSAAQRQRSADDNAVEEGASEAVRYVRSRLVLHGFEPFMWDKSYKTVRPAIDAWAQASGARRLGLYVKDGEVHVMAVGQPAPVQVQLFEAAHGVGPLASAALLVESTRWYLASAKDCVWRSHVEAGLV